MLNLVNRSPGNRRDGIIVRITSRRERFMYDSVIQGGLVADPEANSLIVENIGIKDGKIVYKGKEPVDGKVVIDAGGLVVAPGFIDIHGHVDGHDYCGELSALQGITTTVGGNCGMGPHELDAFFNRQDEKGFIINQAQLIGHSFTLRKAAGIEDPFAPATKKQIEMMTRLAARALDEGACGISLGLEYAPGSSYEELLALARLAANYKRLLPIHTRADSSEGHPSLEEALSLSRDTGCRVVISHFVYQYGYEGTEAALDRMDRAVYEGLDVYIDSGMYTQWATFIGTAVFNEGFILENQEILKDMMAATGPYRGQRLNVELYLKMRAQCPMDTVIHLTGNEEEVFRILKKSYAMPSSDTLPYGRGEGHPQSAGSFPRFFRRMVRERGDLGLLEAVKKASLLPATVLGLKTKGRLAPGNDGDLVVFNIQSLRDRADFPDRGMPDAPPEGIEHVLVNGVPAVSYGKLQSVRPGRSVRFMSSE